MTTIYLNNLWRYKKENNSQFCWRWKTLMSWETISRRSWVPIERVWTNIGEANFQSINGEKQINTWTMVYRNDKSKNKRNAINDYDTWFSSFSYYLNWRNKRSLEKKNLQLLWNAAGIKIKKPQDVLQLIVVFQQFLFFFFVLGSKIIEYLNMIYFHFDEQN